MKFTHHVIKLITLVVVIILSLLLIIESKSLKKDTPVRSTFIAIYNSIYFITHYVAAVYIFYSNNTNLYHDTVFFVISKLQTMRKIKCAIVKGNTNYFHMNIYIGKSSILQYDFTAKILCNYFNIVIVILTIIIAVKKMSQKQRKILF